MKKFIDKMTIVIANVIYDTVENLGILFASIPLPVIAAAELIMGTGFYFCVKNGMPAWFCAVVVMAQFLAAISWSVGWALFRRPFFRSEDSVVLSVSDFFGGYSGVISTVACVVGMSVPLVLVLMVYDVPWATMSLLSVAIIASVAATVVSLVFNALDIATEHEIECRGGEERMEQRVYEKALGI